jgi:hypothetical protein
MRRSSNTPGDTLHSVAAEVIFQPTEPQRKLKATLLAKLADNPLYDLASLSLAQVQELTSNSSVHKWWSTPGFSDWLLDKNENRAKLEYLFSLALEAAEQILMNTDPKAQGSRVAMIKTLAELAGKLPGKQPAAVSKANEIAAVQTMDRTQLMEFLATRGLISSVPNKE